MNTNVAFRLNKQVSQALFTYVIASSYNGGNL